MNRFAKVYVDQIDATLTELGGILEEYEKRLQKALNEKEIKLKEDWEKQREINSLTATLKRMSSVEEENKTLRDKSVKAVEHAHRILGYAKALSEAGK